MSNYITAENLLRALPQVLADDANMQAHGQAIAQALGSLAEKTEEASIYARIGQLAEPLLDILARDFKIDWYDSKASLEAKRRLVRDSFFVHRHLGTKAALLTALTDVHPESTVEEWFEYGGAPFFFRIICDLTEPYSTFHAGRIIQTMALYKSMRSRLEGGSVTLQSRGSVKVSATGGHSKIYYPLCGTVYCGM